MRRKSNSAMLNEDVMSPTCIFDGIQFIESDGIDAAYRECIDALTCFKNKCNALYHVRGSNNPIDKKCNDILVCLTADMIETYFSTHFALDYHNPASRKVPVSLKVLNDMRRHVLLAIRSGIMQQNVNMHAWRIIVGANRITGDPIVSQHYEGMNDEKLYYEWNLQYYSEESESKHLCLADNATCVNVPILVCKVYANKNDDGTISYGFIEVPMDREKKCIASLNTIPVFAGDNSIRCSIKAVDGSAWNNERCAVQANQEREDIITAPYGYAISGLTITAMSMNRCTCRNINYAIYPSRNTDSCEYKLRWTPGLTECVITVSLAPTIGHVIDTDYLFGVYEHSDKISICMFFSNEISMDFDPMSSCEKLNVNDFEMRVYPAILRSNDYNTCMDTYTVIDVKNVSYIYGTRSDRRLEEFVFGIEVMVDASDYKSCLGKDDRYTDSRMIVELFTNPGAMKFIRKEDNIMSKFGIGSNDKLRFYSSTAQVVQCVVGLNDEKNCCESNMSSNLADKCVFAKPFRKGVCANDLLQLVEEDANIPEADYQVFDVEYPQTQEFFNMDDDGRYLDIVIPFKDFEPCKVKLDTNVSKFGEIELYSYNRRANTIHTVIASVSMINVDSVFRLVDPEDTAVLKYSKDGIQRGIVVRVVKDSIDKQTDTIRVMLPRGIVCIEDNRLSHNPGKYNLVSPRFFIDFDKRNGLPVRRFYRSKNGTGGLPGNPSIKEVPLNLKDHIKAGFTCIPGSGQTCVCQLDILGLPGVRFDFSNIMAKDFKLHVRDLDGEKRDRCIDGDGEGEITSVNIVDVNVADFHNPATANIPTVTAKYMFVLTMPPVDEAKSLLTSFELVIPKNAVIYERTVFKGEDITVQSFLNEQSIHFTPTK